MTTSATHGWGSHLETCHRIQRPADQEDLGQTTTSMPPSPSKLFLMRCFELGGMNTPLEFDAVLHEASLPTSFEHNLMALALNEYFIEVGVSQSVTYIDL